MLSGDLHITPDPSENWYLPLRQAMREQLAIETIGLRHDPSGEAAILPGELFPLHLKVLGDFQVDAGVHLVMPGAVRIEARDMSVDAAPSSVLGEMW